MTLTIDTIMAYTIAVVAIVGRLYKGIVGDKVVKRFKLSKLTPIVLLPVGIGIELIASGFGIVGVLKGIICTAVACLGFDTVKGLFYNGVGNVK